MSKHENSRGIPLPRGWSHRVKSAMLNVIALAQYAAAYTRGWAVNSPIARQWLAVEAMPLETCPHTRGFNTPPQSSEEMARGDVAQIRERTNIEGGIIAGGRSPTYARSVIGPQTDWPVRKTSAHRKRNAMPGGSVPTLLNRVVSPNPRVSWDAAIALKGLGRAAAVAVPVLTGLLGGETAHVRASAAYVLGEVGAENRDTVSALIGALGDENVDVRRLAAEALGQLGLEARAAVRALIRTLRDEHMIVAGYAAWALKQIGVAPGDCIRIEVHDKYGLAKHSFACLQDQLEPLEGFVSSLIEALHDDESASRVTRTNDPAGSQSLRTVRPSAVGVRQPERTDVGERLAGNTGTRPQVGQPARWPTRRDDPTVTPPCEPGTARSMDTFWSGGQLCQNR